MGIFDPASSETTLNQYNLWTPEQQNLFNSYLQMAQNGQVTNYPGQTSVGRTAEDEAYFKWAGGSSGSAREEALRSILGDAGMDPAQREKYYQEAFYNPAMREYNTSILPQTMEAASGAGFHSSDTLRSMAEAGTGLETNLAAKRAELLWQDILNQREAGAKAYELGEQAYSNEGARLGTAGSYARQIEQEKIAGDLSRWLAGESVGGMSNAYANPSIQLGLSLLGITPYGYGTSTSASGGGLGYGALSGLSSGVGSALGTAGVDALVDWLKGLV